MADNNRILKIMGIISLMVVIIIYMLIPKYNCKEEFENTRKVVLQYHIDSLFVSNNHATPTLVVTGVMANKYVKQLEIGVSDIQYLYGNVSKGDSIYKAAGSLEF